jgi:hypothetical protein
MLSADQSKIFKPMPRTIFKDLTSVKQPESHEASPEQHPRKREEPIRIVSLDPYAAEQSRNQQRIQSMKNLKLMRVNKASLHLQRHRSIESLSHSQESPRIRVVMNKLQTDTLLLKEWKLPAVSKF